MKAVLVKIQSYVNKIVINQIKILCSRHTLMKVRMQFHEGVQININIGPVGFTSWPQHFITLVMVVNVFCKTMPMHLIWGLTAQV